MPSLFFFFMTNKIALSCNMHYAYMWFWVCINIISYSVFSFFKILIIIIINIKKSFFYEILYTVQLFTESNSKNIESKNN